MSTATATIVDLSAYRERRAKQRGTSGNSVTAAANTGVFFFVMPVSMVPIWPTFWPVAPFAAETQPLWSISSNYRSLALEKAADGFWGYLSFLHKKVRGNTMS